MCVDIWTPPMRKDESLLETGEAEKYFQPIFSILP